MRWGWLAHRPNALRKELPRYAAAATLGFVAAAWDLPHADAAEVPVYRETFNLPDPLQGDPEGLSSFEVAEAVGWFGRRNGGSKGRPGGSTNIAAPLQVFGPGCEPLESIGNDPVFAGDGRGTWTPQVLGVSIWTEEFSFDAGLITRITFQMQHNQTTSNNRLALLMGDTWYISDQFFNNTGGACQQASFDLATTTFGTSPVILPGMGTECFADGLPCGPFKPEPETTGVPLPTSGIVDGFGIFIDGTSANHRFDNYTVYATFEELGQCTSFLLQQQCSGLTGMARARCNQEQIGVCHGLFGVPSRHGR